ncbi:MAG: lysostaphin resistance A-like protein [Acidimicrobiales bacterium]
MSVESRPVTLIPEWVLFLVGLVALLAVPVVAIVSTKPLFGWEDVSEISMGAAVFGIAVGWIAVGAVMYLASRQSGESFRAHFGLRFEAVDILGLPLGVALQFAMVLLYWPLLKLLDDADVDEVAQDLAEQARSSGSLGVTLLVLSAVVLAPVMEELFFRGMLFGLLGRVTPTYVAIFGSAVIFGGIHFQALQFLGLFVVGAATAFVVSRSSGRLGMAILLHAGFNATTVVFVLL